MLIEPSGDGLDLRKALSVCPAVRVMRPGERLARVPNAVEGYTALIPIERCIGCGICVKGQPEHLKMLEW